MVDGFLLGNSNVLRFKRKENILFKWCSKKRSQILAVAKGGGGHLIRLGASTSAGYIRRASFTCRSRTDRRAQDCRRGKQLNFHHEQG